MENPGRLGCRPLVFILEHAEGSEPMACESPPAGWGRAGSRDTLYPGDGCLGSKSDAHSGGRGGGQGWESELQVTSCSPEPPYERVLWLLPFDFRGWTGIIASHPPAGDKE